MSKTATFRSSVNESVGQQQQLSTLISESVQKLEALAGQSEPMRQELENLRWVLERTTQSLGQLPEMTSQAATDAAEKLAQSVEPIGQSMAAIADNTAQTLDQTKKFVKVTADRAKAQSDQSWSQATKTLERVDKAAATLEGQADALRRSRWQDFGILLALLAVLLAGFGYWLKQPWSPTDRERQLMEWGQMLEAAWPSLPKASQDAVLAAQKTSQPGP